jgi:hypothetical protein
LKYRPSVAKAAFSVVTTAVPADPVKPEMKANKKNSGELCFYGIEVVGRSRSRSRRGKRGNANLF